MSKKTILLMRHAEKPEDLSDPNLSPAGEKRAHKLTKYLPDQFGEPKKLFAAAISKHSARPYETLKPLSEKTGLDIEASIADQDYEILATELLTKYASDDELIVVCWHHHHIPGLARALMAEDGSYPDPWDPEVFNAIVRLDFHGDGVPKVTLIEEPF